MTRRTCLAALLVGALSVAVAQPAHGHYLGYGKAKRVAQARADRFAGMHTNVAAVLRLGEHSYQVQARWTRDNPNGCQECEYDPVTGWYDSPMTEHCSVDIKVRFKSPTSRKIRTSILESSCI